jgi:chromosome segregation ATPase
MKNHRDGIKSQVKDNRKSFREDAGKMKEMISNLTDEQKTQLKEATASTKSAMEALRAKMKTEDITDEQKDEIREEMKALHEAHAEKVKEIFGNSEEIKDFLEKRKAMHEQNKEVRMQGKEERQEMKSERHERVKKHKEKFQKRLTNVIPNASVEKLEKLEAKIDRVLEKIEANEKMSDDKKTQLSEQLE